MDGHDLLRQYMQINRVSIIRFGLKSGIHKSSIYRFVRREIAPTPEQAIMIEQATEGYVQAESWPARVERRGASRKPKPPKPVKPKPPKPVKPKPPGIRMSVTVGEREEIRRLSWQGVTVAHIARRLRIEEYRVLHHLPTSPETKVIRERVKQESKGAAYE
jgi:hypothetical protein